MKNIDIKSLLIGCLLTSTILLGVAAIPRHTGDLASDRGGKWDDTQQWFVKRLDWETSQKEALEPKARGVATVTEYEPFAATDKHIYFRQRFK